MTLQEVAFRLSIVGTRFSPLSTVIEPSGLIVTLRHAQAGALRSLHCAAHLSLCEGDGAGHREFALHSASTCFGSGRVCRGGLHPA